MIVVCDLPPLERLRTLRMGLDILPSARFVTARAIFCVSRLMPLRGIAVTFFTRATSPFFLVLVLLVVFVVATGESSFFLGPVSL